MTISAAMKMHAAALGNEKIWTTCPSTDHPTYTFINDRQEEIFCLVATVCLNKYGGITGHLGLVMSPVEFASLVPLIPIFPQGTHQGDLDFTGATLVNQHTERRLQYKGRLHVFELEQMIEEQYKNHIMSCFHKDIYCALKDDQLGWLHQHPDGPPL